MMVWFCCSLLLTFGRWTVAAALLNLFLCRYFFVHMRWKGVLRGMGAPGFMTYWLSAAARGQGDVQAAWDAAQAGWVRAVLASGRGAALRADLDRLVVRGLVPDRAKALAQPPETLRMEWERFKERWASK